MKTSALLSALLFGSLAVAAPFDKRALAYKTEIVTETVVIYTTVYEDEPTAQATSTSLSTPAAYFYQQPATSSRPAAQPTPSVQAAQVPAYAPPAPPAPQKPSSPYVAPAPQTPSPAPAPSSTPAPVVVSAAPAYTPPPVEAPAPAPTTSAYLAPAPAPAPVSSAVPAPVSSAAPAPVSSSAPSSQSGGSGAMEYQNVDITIYDNNGGFGACGTALTDSDMIVAIAQPAWGKSTYDVMTGAATNPWCGQQVDIEYNGNHVTATIMDMCPGCAGHDLDLSLAVWTKLTGLAEKTRLKASWSPKSS
ncbi:hypothetical protein ACEQ8H_001586 [Pleosporales sp. CAS-2024a]